jgi:nitrogen regulatory protein P-II 2
MEGLKLLTILAEPEIAELLAADLRAAGARGLALTEGRAEWQRAIASRESFDGPVVRIETVVGPDVVERAMRRLAEKWFPHYAVLAWVSDAEVLRPDRYRS